MRLRQRLLFLVTLPAAEVTTAFGQTTGSNAWHPRTDTLPIAERIRVGTCLGRVATSLAEAKAAFRVAFCPARSSFGAFGAIELACDCEGVLVIRRSPLVLCHRLEFQ
jgi:hypothetical protein